MTSHDHQTFPCRLVTNHLLAILRINGFCFHAFFTFTLAQCPPLLTHLCSRDILGKISSQPHLSCENLLVNPGVQSQAVIVQYPGRQVTRHPKICKKLKKRRYFTQYFTQFLTVIYKERNSKSISNKQKNYREQL